MQVSDQIIAVLNDLCAKFGMAIDWSSENIVPYVSQLCERYIRYEIATSAAWMVVIAVLPAILLVIAKKSDDSDIYVPCRIIGCVMALVAFVTISVQAFDIIECLTIPEKTIFEYITLLMRQHR